MFWSEIPPSNHLVQIYETDVIFMDSLEGYVVGGIQKGECVVVIATSIHLTELAARLQRKSYHVDILLAGNQYIQVDAEAALKQFMKGGWPDDALFLKFVTKLLASAREHERPVRAFGEMVALLWAQGNRDATIRLEELWTQFCNQEHFPIFCAYPRAGFSQDTTASIMHICEAHSKVIDGWTRPRHEVFFKS
jgi:hypothetical protein